MFVDQSALPRSLLKPFVNECMSANSWCTVTFLQEEVIPVKMIADAMMISFFIVLYFVSVQFQLIVLLKIQKISRHCPDLF